MVASASQPGPSQPRPQLPGIAHPQANALAAVTGQQPAKVIEIKDDDEEEEGTQLRPDTSMDALLAQQLASELERGSYAQAQGLYFEGKGILIVLVCNQKKVGGCCCAGHGEPPEGRGCGGCRAASVQRGRSNRVQPA